jgi:hypothetical protein
MAAVRSAFARHFVCQIKDCDRKRLGSHDSAFVRSDNAQAFVCADAFPAALLRFGDDKVGAQSLVANTTAGVRGIASWMRGSSPRMTLRVWRVRASAGRLFN